MLLYYIPIDGNMLCIKISTNKMPYKWYYIKYIYANTNGGLLQYTTVGDFCFFIHNLKNADKCKYVVNYFVEKFMEFFCIKLETLKTLPLQ